VCSTGKKSTLWVYVWAQKYSAPHHRSNGPVSHWASSSSSAVPKQTNRAMPLAKTNTRKFGTSETYRPPATRAAMPLAACLRASARGLPEPPTAGPRAHRGYAPPHTHTPGADDKNTVAFFFQTKTSTVVVVPTPAKVATAATSPPHTQKKEAWRPRALPPRQQRSSPSPSPLPAPPPPLPASPPAATAVRGASGPPPSDAPARRRTCPSRVPRRRRRPSPKSTSSSSG
jgi:hypothetical protein